MRASILMSCALTLVSLGPYPVLAQDEKSNAVHGGVVTSKLFPPLYPPLARIASVDGEVRLSLVVGVEGEVKSAKIVSGNQLLQQATLQSAQQSKFECTGCAEPVTYEMVYSFQLIAKHCEGEKDSVSDIAGDTRQPGVSQSGNRVVVLAEQGCLTVDHSIVPMPKVRSPKCLYLWPCARPNKPGVWK